MCNAYVHINVQMCKLKLQSVHRCAKAGKGIAAHFGFCYSRITKQDNHQTTTKLGGNEYGNEQSKRTDGKHEIIW